MKSGRYVLAGFEADVTACDTNTVRIRVTGPDGRLRVTAPSWASPDLVELVLFHDADKIRRQQQKAAQQASSPPKVAHPRPKKWQSGETAWLWGRRLTLDVQERANWAIRAEDDRLVVECPAWMSATARQARADAWMARELAAAVRRLRPEVEAAAGQHCEDWRIRKMNTRWGSCSIQTRRIRLSLQLAEMPEECLRYVMTHELGHFVTRFHNAIFRAWMTRVLPDWRKTEKLMKEW